MILASAQPSERGQQDKEEAGIGYGSESSMKNLIMVQHQTTLVATSVHFGANTESLKNA